MTKIQVRTVTYDAKVGNLYSDTPPGLLLSLGDGSAIQTTYRQIAAGIEWADRYTDAETMEAKVQIAIGRIIQQAQEARNNKDENK